MISTTLHNVSFDKKTLAALKRVGRAHRIDNRSAVIRHLAAEAVAQIEAAKAAKRAATKAAKAQEQEAQ